MPKPAQKILLVEPDAELVELLVASLARRFNAHVTCVADAESCLDVEIIEPHDLAVVEMSLSDATGLQLAEQLLALSARPVVMLADEVTADEAVSALRMGVRELLPKPFAVAEFLDSVGRLLASRELHRRHTTKYRRMRELVRRVIRERRDLNRRTELICRDLVQAQRRLVHRVLAIENNLATPPV